MISPLAYIDPGSGFAVWQAITAAALGSIYYLRRWFVRFRKKRNSNDPNA